MYFGPIGENSRTLLDYFETHGGRKCGDQENPAEYMLEIVNQGKNDKDQDWYNVWNDSEERGVVLNEIEEMHAKRRDEPEEHDPHAGDEFAMPFMTQLKEVYRKFRRYQRLWPINNCNIQRLDLLHVRFRDTVKKSKASQVQLMKPIPNIAH